MGKMKMRRMIGLCAAIALIAGCSDGSTLGVYDTKDAMAPAAMKYDVAVEEKPAEAEAAAADGTEMPSQGVPTANPRIAYSYTLGYRLGTGDVGAVQTRHIALCDKLGTAKCRIKSMQRSVSDGEFVNAGLNLVLDATIARNFQTELDKAVESAGGESTSREMDAEDLSKQMVDTEARIKAKQALADRLMVLLRTRSGKVGDLVEAERAFAEAQEELEAARSWMTEMQARVAMSDIKISYNSDAPAGSGLWRPIRDAFGEVGQILGDSVGTLLRFVVALAPWLTALWGLVWVIRRRGWTKGWRWRFWRKKEATELQD
jgi:hypothetical protein